MRVSVTAENIAKGIRRDCTGCPVAAAIASAIGVIPIVTDDLIEFGNVILSEGPQLRTWIRTFDKFGGQAVQPCVIDLNITGMRAEIVNA